MSRFKEEGETMNCTVMIRPLEYFVHQGRFVPMSTGKVGESGTILCGEGRRLKGDDFRVGGRISSFRWVVVLLLLLLLLL